MKIIEIQNLSKSFGSIQALKDVDIVVEEGEIFGFLGPNGAGKTTTIRCVMDFIRPDVGEINILGGKVSYQDPSLKSQIGFLSGEVNLFKEWTGQEHIDLVSRIRKGENNSEELMERFDFDPSKKMKEYSTGNKQKLALILALMHKPRLLILDEPTTGLDPLLQQEFYEIIGEYSDQGITVFMSSHILTEVERLCTRVAVIKKGIVEETADINELKSKKIYTVYAYFDNPLTKKMEEQLIKDKHVEIEKRLKDGLILTVRNDVDYILKTISKYELRDLEIHHANLEKVFLEYYK